MKRMNLNRFLWLAALCALPFCELAAEEPVQPTPFRTVAFSHDAKLLAAGFGEKDVSGGLVIWNTDDHSVACRVNSEIGISTVSFSPDGRWLAFTKYDHPPDVLDVAKREATWSLPEPCRGPVCFSPDGKLLACGGADKGIHLFDVKARSEQKVIDGAKDRIYGRMNFSPDGKMLVTACGTAGAFVWDLTSGKPLHQFKHGQYFVRSAEFSSDGEWIISGGYDGTVRIWNAKTGEFRARLNRVGGSALAVSDDRNTLVITGDKTISVFELGLGPPSAETVAVTQQRLSALESDSYPVRQSASEGLVALGFRAESILRQAAENSPNAEVRIRARLARQRILSEPTSKLRGHTSDVTSVAISPDAHSIASASDDGTVRLWELSSYKEIACLHAPILTPRK
jgi:WD40 repeat protein